MSINAYEQMATGVTDILYISIMNKRAPLYQRLVPFRVMVGRFRSILHV